MKGSKNNMVRERICIFKIVNNNGIKSVASKVKTIK